MSTAPLLQQAALLARQGQLAQALDLCEQAIGAAPGDAEAWRFKAGLAAAMDRMDEAAGAFERSLALRPDDGATLLDYGSALAAIGAHEPALVRLQQAAQALPADPRAPFRAAVSAFSLGRYEHAATLFEQALQRKPDWVEAWNNLATAHTRADALAPALAAARRAQDLRPDEPAQLHTLAAVLSRTFDRAQLEEGLAHAQRALALAPDFAGAHELAAIILRKLDRMVEARPHARRALELQPENPDYAVLYGDLLLDGGEAAASEPVYAAALRRSPDHPVLLRQHAIAQLLLARPAPAQAQLERALTAAPQDQRAIAHLGVALSMQGRHAPARALIGLDRHVRAVPLAAPEGFADTAAFHAALAQDIRRHSQQRFEPPGLAARRAWLSGDLLADRTAAIVGFEQRLTAAIADYIASLQPDPEDVFLRAIPRRWRMHVWATRSDDGGRIDTHIHEESWLSGAYYVELPPGLGAGPDDPAGWIEFGRPFASLPAPPEDWIVRMRPQVGTLLLFPSYLFHRTLPYRGEGERISISFDLAAVD
ncbi:MAG TPA: putative 2OG-Fe(II) oxygenase [Xanthomonadaceae bacterium]|nr:putative 2OG-Fe(II) oxygenase [Xanthomonadaceae bacterium]